MRLTVSFGRIATCVGTVVIFATAASGTVCKNKPLAGLSRRMGELGRRAGDITQRLDDSAERANDCLYGVKRCPSPRLKGVRSGLDKFDNELDKVWNTFDKAGDKLQDGIVTK